MTRARKIGILVALCVVAAVWFFVEPNPIEKKKDLLFEGTNLGWISQLDAFESAFTVRNNSDELITIDAVDGSCTCMAKLPKEKIVIKPNTSVSIPYTLNVSATQKFNLGNDFAFNIWTYINYHKQDGCKQVSTTEISGKVHRALQSSSEYMYCTTTLGSDGVELRNGGIIHVETYGSYRMSITNINKSFSYDLSSHNNKHAIRMRLPSSFHGKIDDMLLVRCYDSSNLMVADRHIPVYGHRELFSLSPQSVFVDARDQQFITVLVSSVARQAFSISKIELDSKDVTSHCKLNKTTTGTVVMIPSDLCSNRTVNCSRFELHLLGSDGNTAPLTLFAHHIDGH